MKQRILDILPFFAFPAAVLFAHIFGSKFLNLYALIPNMDIPVHFIGGFSIAYTATQVLSYLENRKIIEPLNRFIFLLLLVSLTATTAVLWEFAEFGLDRLLHLDIQINLANTMQDQFMGICGGATWALIYDKKVLAHQKAG
jgi:hypothetical protein